MTPPSADDNAVQSQIANFDIGPSSIAAYTRLNYTLWYALAEFIDNSTQSRVNYAALIDPVLEAEGKPLCVEITYNPEERSLTIIDNSIGMDRDRLIAGLRIAHPTADSRGRSRYGMGLKTAACWIGQKWHVRTCMLGSGVEWRAAVSVDEVASGNTAIPLKPRSVPADKHYTEIKIWELNRSLQKRTEETIMSYLGAMYRIDIRNKRLIILFNRKPVPLPEEMEFAKLEDGRDAREEFDTTIRGKRVRGWFGVLRTGGRKFGGFSLLQNDRQIRGYPDSWKPRSVFGGVDEEGGNSLVSQRLTGEIILDGFEVSHTKDAINWQWDEEEKLERFLVERTAALKRYATTMRTKGGNKNAWDRERLKEILEEAKQEFASAEFRDTVIDAALPPLDVIQQSNERQAEALSESDMLLEIPDVGAGIRVNVAFQTRSENDPHLTFVPAESSITVIINELHPYYAELEDSTERVKEIVLQFVYDAVAEFRVAQRLSRQEPDAVRKLKDQLLRAKIKRLENKDAEHTERELEKLRA
jgi:arsenate reductase-like glutaredoxin family protein